MGPYGSYEFGSPTAINRAEGVINTFSTQGKGISWDNSWGIGVKMQLPSLFTNDLGASFGLRYSWGSGIFKSDEFTGAFGNEDFKIYSVYKKLEASVSTLYSLSKKWYVSGGVWLQYRLQDSLSEQLEYLSDTSKPDEIIASGKAIGTSRVHYGIPISIGGHFPISRSLYVTAEAFMRFDLGEMFRGFGSMAYSSGASFGILFDLEPPPVPVVIEDEQNDKPAENFLRTSVFLNVNGISVRRTTAHITDTLRSRYIALPATIELTSGAMPSFFHSLTREEALSFDPSMLDRANAVTCYANILNIIGKRMTDLPNEKIVLTSHSASYSNIVEKYLTETFGIAASRIEHKVKNDSSVTIGGSMKLLSPLINQWRDEYRQTPEIAIDKIISSSVGVKSWSITITDGPSIIARYSNADEAPTTMTDREIDTKPHTLVAHLVATDSLGSVSEAIDSLQIVQDLNEKHLNAETGSVIVLADSIGNPQSWSSILLDQVVRSTDTHRTITIRPLYTDDESSYLVLKSLLDRLKKVGSHLKRVSIEPTPLFGNAPPPKVLSSAIEILYNAEK